MDESALFRHEIAYVLGQLQHPASVSALTLVCLVDFVTLKRYWKTAQRLTW